MRATDELSNGTVLDADGGRHRLGEVWQHRPVVLALIRHFA